jgi:hypothetical protein
MSRLLVLASLLLLASWIGPPTIAAQDWTPPSREMPQMPSLSELTGDWLAPRAAWFAGVARVSGIEPSALRAQGEAPRGSATSRVVRFSSGPVPVVTWADRNGDGRADLIEIYRGGTISVQLVDADYDGVANVLRLYDAGGTLLRENRL